MKVITTLGLCALGAGCSSTPAPQSDSIGTTSIASLGLRTSVPSQELGEEMGLTFNVRWEGRIIDEVTPGGAAEKAGVKSGDVLLAIDGITLFSQDDISDFLAVSSPGQEVSVELKRVGKGDAEELRVTLGAESAPLAREPELGWQFASLAQLPKALELARAEKKKVMVGLSGAET